MRCIAWELIRLIKLTDVLTAIDSKKSLMLLLTCATMTIDG